MELSELIERGVRVTGSRTHLAEALDLRPNQITDAKRKGLPIAACFQLAELIGANPAEVIAASELVTEKKPERRAILATYAQHAICIALSAGVILTATPSPANAALVLKTAGEGFVLCEVQWQSSRALEDVRCTLERPLATPNSLCDVVHAWGQGGRL